MDRKHATFCNIFHDMGQSHLHSTLSSLIKIMAKRSLMFLFQVYLMDMYHKCSLFLTWQALTHSEENVISDDTWPCARSIVHYSMSISFDIYMSRHKYRVILDRGLSCKLLGVCPLYCFHSRHVIRVNTVTS